MVDYWRFTRNRHTRMMYDALKTYGITATRMYEYRTAGDVSVTPSLKPPDGVTVESLHASELGSLAGDIDFSLPVTVSNGEWTVVASADGRPIGRALVTDDPNPYVDPLERQVSVSGAYVRKIFVVPGWRGAGVASATRTASRSYCSGSNRLRTTRRPDRHGAGRRRQPALVSPVRGMWVRAGGNTRVRPGGTAVGVPTPKLLTARERSPVYAIRSHSNIYLLRKFIDTKKYSRGCPTKQNSFRKPGIGW